MEFMIDYDIIGEILFPLKEVQIGNSPSETPQPKLSYSNIIQSTYVDYRNVLLQGENIKFYLMLKCTQRDVPLNKEMFNNFYFQIEFESTHFQSTSTTIKEDKNDISLKNDEYEKTLTDLFSTNTEKFNNLNQHYENIISKEYDEESQTMVYEILKQIIVPQNLLNVNLIMKLHLMTKNEISYINGMDAFDLYQNGYYNTVENYKLLKTIYKMVKIIRPIKIEETKQRDILIDMSLLQAKIENTTAHVNFIDNSLMFSKFIKSVPKDNEKVIKKGLTISLNEVQILKDETTLDERQISSLSKLKDIYIEKGKMCISNVNFTIYKTEFPIKIKPGEIYNLTLKVQKSAFLNEKNDNKTKVENRYINNITSTYNDIRKVVNRDLRSSSIQQKQREKYIEGIITPSRGIIEEPCKTLSKPNKKQTSVLFNLLNFTIDSEKNAPINSDTSKESINDNESKESKVDNKIPNEDEKDQNFQISFMTPVILCFSSDIFSENLFMCIQMKWNNEINRFLKVEINIPENIYLHEYFEVSLKCRNISSNEMNLFIEISDSFEDMKINEGMIFDYQLKNFDVIPSILSQTKMQNFGMFNCNADKIFYMKFLTLKKGFSSLPNFTITDRITGKRFFFVHNNKIHITEREKLK